MQIFFGVVILAAGGSRRMGRPKPLLPWGRTSVLGHLLQQWNELGAAHVATVCAADAQPIHDELSRLGSASANRILNPAPERGMFSSIQCAAGWSGWKAVLSHWVIALGDQPHLRHETLKALVELGREKPECICQPLRQGHRKHPLWLPKQEFAALANSAASDLKGFLAERFERLAGFESDDAGLDFDMDTPEEYERARRLGTS